MGDDLILVSVSSERYLVSLLILRSLCRGSVEDLDEYAKLSSSCRLSQHLSYASGDLMVDASFMQTLWNMNPISSGCELAEGLCSTFLNKHDDNLRFSI